MGSTANERAAQRIAAVKRSRGTALVLGGLELKQLPAGLGELRELTTLDISGNRLTDVPAEVWSLEQLEHLDLGSNRVPSLDAAIARLTRLQTLDASENRLTSLPAELASTLRELHLYRNLISTVPVGLLELNALEVLDLSNNQIASLPPLTGRWSALRVLDLSGNELVDLPEGIGTLSELRVLDLSRNRLRSVAGLAALSNLEELYVDDNELEHVPSELATRSPLRIVSAERNAVVLSDSFAAVDAAPLRSRVYVVMREHVSGGAARDVRYADQPAFHIGTGVAIGTARSVRRFVDVYYKQPRSVPAVTLKYPGGATVELGKLSRKSALTLTAKFEHEIEPSAPVITVHAPARERDVDVLAAFTGEIATRIPDARVVDSTTGLTLISANPVERDLGLGPFLGHVLRGEDTPKPAPSPAPGPSPQPVHVQFSASAPAEVKVGAEAVIDVQAALAGTVRPLEHASEIVDVAPDQPIKAFITIQGDAFEAQEPRVVKLDVPSAPDRPSSTVFSVRALREGDARVAILFRQGGTELANIAFGMRATFAEPARRNVTDTAKSAPRNPADDDDANVLLVVDDIPGADRYRFTVISEKFGWDFIRFESLPLVDAGSGAAATARQYVESLYKKMTEGVLTSIDDVVEFARKVNAVGADMGKQVFPTELVRLLWDKRDDLAVHVKSFEPYLPWEIARLVHPDSRMPDDRFMAEYDLVRSFSGAWRPDRLKFDRWSLLVADYPNKLEASLKGEKTAVLEMLAKRGITAKELDTRPGAVFDALEAAEFDVLHVCCHGTADHSAIDNSALVIGDRLVGDKVVPIELDPVTVRWNQRLEERHPLIFLDACESGRVGASLTQWSGWPKTFWDAGAGAFVGSSWPVRTKPARAFYEKFYDSMQGGRTLAQAAGDAREAAKPLGDATWLAFKVYGNPVARKA